jgi:hypothetical protein
LNLKQLKADGGKLVLSLRYRSFTLAALERHFGREVELKRALRAAGACRKPAGLIAVRDRPPMD